MERQARIDAELFDSIPDTADHYRQALQEATPEIREAYWRAMKRHKWLPLASLLPHWLLRRLGQRYDDEGAFVNGPEYGSSFWEDAAYSKYVRIDKRRKRDASELVELGAEVVHRRFERDSGHPGQSGPMNPEDVDDLVYEVLKAVGTIK